MGMAAFDRHNFTAAGVLLRAPAEHGNARAQAVLCFLHTHGRGVPQQEISAVSDTNATGLLTPTISEHKVKSTLSVADGQTVLLAGLISETQNKTRNGIPGLDQLPGYLGDVFSHQNRTIDRTELIIFIRPQIIRDAVDAHLVAEELRAKLKSRIGEVSPKHQNGALPLSAR